MKNEYVNKYNEMLDLLENARKKKEVITYVLNRLQTYTLIIRRKNMKKLGKI